MRHKHIFHDMKKRSRIKKTEARRLALKILRNSDVAWYPKTKFEHRRTAGHRGRCILTGRSRGVYNLYFRISRLMIRELASKGLLPGLKKASW